MPIYLLKRSDECTWALMITVTRLQSGKAEKTPYRHLFSTDSSPDSSPVFGIVETGRVSWSAWRRRGRTPKPTTLRRTASQASCAALRALRPAVFSGASAVVVVPDGVFYNYRNYRRDVVELVNAARLPAIYPERDYADDGGLMCYGANVRDNFRRAAGYVERILKGAGPADLPIQEPVKFDFVVNLKTAKELGLTIPPLILGRADEVIE